MKMNNDKINKIKELTKNMRRVILETSLNCGEPAHLGGALSIVDVLAVLYDSVISVNLKKPSDRFILSKGHGFLGLLSILYCKNFIKKNQLMNFQKNGSEIIAHPIMNSKIGIETSNGSLGQGLSFAAGLAIAYKKKKKKGSIFVLVGDGECYEGSVWEAAITSTENNLTNLKVIVDCNGFQNDGAINKKMNVENMFNKWNGFGWNTIKCDGHNISQLFRSLKKEHKFKPTAIIMETTKGKGVKFMENNNDWHHGRLTQKLYDEAISKI